MATDRELVRQRFYDRIESDATFFIYYGDLEDNEIQALADERVNTYLREAVVILRRKSDTDLTFAMDEDSDEFVEDLTDEEIQLIGGDLAFEVYVGRDIAKMKARASIPSFSDFVAKHSPANERDSLVNMYKFLQDDNLAKITEYNAKDRLTGKYKTVNSVGVAP